MKGFKGFLRSLALVMTGVYGQMEFGGPMEMAHVLCIVLIGVGACFGWSDSA